MRLICPGCRSIITYPEDRQGETTECASCRLCFPAVELAQPHPEDLPEALPATPSTNKPIQSEERADREIQDALPARPRVAARQEPIDVIPLKQPTGRPVRSAAADVVWWPSIRTQGVSTQNGVAVFTPAYFAFLPSQARRNLVVSLVGGFVANVAVGALGGQLISIPQWISYDRRLRQLVDNPEEFDAYVREAAEQEGGLIWVRVRVTTRRIE